MSDNGLTRLTDPGNTDITYADPAEDARNAQGAPLGMTLQTAAAAERGVLAYLATAGHLTDVESVRAREHIIDLLSPKDFRHSHHAAVFEVCAHLQRTKATYTELEVQAGLESLKVEFAQQVLDELSEGSLIDERFVDRYIDGMLNLRAFNELSGYTAQLAGEITDHNRGWGQMRDPVATAETYAGFFRQVADRALRSGTIEGLYEKMSAMVPKTNPNYIAQDLLRSNEVMIVSAGGGIGKSAWGRALAFAVENGLYPMTGSPGAPTGCYRALVIDLETQDINIAESTNWMLNKVSNILGCRAEDVAEPALYSRRGRLDIRERSARARLRDMIRQIRPRFVVMGPLKNLFMEEGNESYSQAALETQDIFMQLMADYDFCLYLEAHGTRMSKTSTAGSQRWEDWPDISLGVEKVDRPPKSPTSAYEKAVERELALLKGPEMLLRVHPNREPRNTGAYYPRLMVRSPIRGWPFEAVNI